MTDRRTLTPRILLIGGTIALVLVRLALSTQRSGPVVVADEIGYLMNARVLAGGAHGQLALAPFYHGGYSLLLAPILAVTSDPATDYHLVLALNALLAAAVFPLLYVLLRHCAGFRPRLALGAAFAGALYPSVTILSQVALSENALCPLSCVWLIAGTRLLAARERRGRMLWAAISAGSAAALYAVHGRMVVTVVLTVALLLWRMIRTRLAAREAVVGLVVLGAGLLGAHFLSASLIDANYGGHATNEATTRLSGLEHPHALLEFLENLAGQTWSLTVATFGLAVVSMSAMLRGGTRSAPARAPMLLLAALTAGLLLVSAGSFPERTRADMLIYGRYVEVVAPALIALGLAIIGRERAWTRPRAGLLVLAVLTGVVVLTSATSHGLTGANRWNVASLPFRTGDLGPATLLGAAVVALAGAALLGSSARRPAQMGWILCVLLFAATTAYSMHSPVLEAQDAVYPDGWTSPTTAAERFHIRAVGYDLDRTSARGGYPTVGGLYVVQWFLPGSRVLLFHGRRASPPSRFVLTDRDRQSGQVLWTAVGADEALVRLNR